MAKVKSFMKRAMNAWFEAAAQSYVRRTGDCWIVNNMDGTIVKG
jgi:hypothetical protein